MPENPSKDEFQFSADDGVIWMQCILCRETWEVANLRDATNRWNEHECNPRR